jgi:hypothetical protein
VYSARGGLELEGEGEFFRELMLKNIRENGAGR